MKDYLISMFIDDELDFDEKIEFVTTVHQDGDYADETIELLEQEKLLRAPMVERLPEVQLGRVQAQKSRLPPWLFGVKPVSCLAGTLAAVVLMLLFRPVSQVAGPQLQDHRFVIFQPEANRAEIVGSFTDWKPVPMERVGAAGYWSITLPLSTGEYRYSFLMDQGAPMADPTVSSREHDDFGGENSILRI